MIKQISNLVDNYNKWNYSITSFRKIASQASIAWTAMDFSMASGNPSPNFYSWIELEATILDSTKWIWTWWNVTWKKYLHEISATTTSAWCAPITMILCDYLMFYPQVDMDSVDVQNTTNPINLPRYESWEWVKMFVIAQYPYIWNVTFTINYTNSDWVDKNTPIIRTNTATYIWSMIHWWALTGSVWPFIPLASWDKWVRKVNSITFTWANWWLWAIVLVKPLATFTINEITAPSETNYIKDMTSIPEIKNWAFINFIGIPWWNVSWWPIFWTIKTIFDN